MQFNQTQAQGVNQSASGGFDLGGLMNGITNVLNPVGMATNIGTSVFNSIQNAVNADRNFALQGQVFDYQKRMQQQAWGREDNAVQRRVADLKAAGLSPVLAAGSSASSSAPISLNAPQRQQTNVNVPVQESMAAYTGQLKAMQEMAQSAAQMKLVDSQIKQINQQTEFNRKDAKMMYDAGLPSNATAENKASTEMMNQIMKGFGQDPANPASGPLMNMIRGLGPILIKVLETSAKIKK